MHQWLRRLGSHVHFIRRILIDMNTICPADCFESKTGLCSRFMKEEDGWLDFGPLLRAVWDLDMAVDISVVQPMGAAHEAVVRKHIRDRNVTYEPVTACNAASLTDVVRSLCKDELELKKYGRQISTIGLARDGSGGVIHFDKTH